MQEAKPGQLDNINLLTELPVEELRDLERRATWRRYERNEQILDRNSENRDVFFVVQGAVQIANYSLSGREISLAMVSEGAYFGELSAIDDAPRSASVTASERSLLAAVSPTTFRDLLARDARIAFAVLQNMANVIRACDERIMDLSTLGAVQRVYVELLRLAGPDPAVPNFWSIYPMPTQADIAGRASTTRETVARVLSQLTSAEIVERKGKTLYLKDRGKLQALSERLDRDHQRAATR